ncbi:MAG TPA: hypothetical protein GX498_06770 [Clostridiales bacterium]|nr:hypothetical protein [Clostridiales bacterium]
MGIASHDCYKPTEGLFGCNWIWIILLILFLCGGFGSSCCFGNSFLGGNLLGNNCLWILIVLFIIFFCCRKC